MVLVSPHHQMSDPVSPHHQVLGPWSARPGVAQDQRQPGLVQDRPLLNYEASTSSSSSARLRNSESVEIRVLPACDQNVSQQSSSEQEFPPSSLHSDRLIPRLDSLPHISSSSYLVTRSLTQGRTSAMSTHTSGVQPTSPPTFLLQVTKT